MIKPTGIISTSIFLQGWFQQYLNKVVTTVVSLQFSLPVSLHNDILCHLYEGISTIESLLSSLLESVKSEFLLSSLLKYIEADVDSSANLLQNKTISNIKVLYNNV